MLPVSRLTVFGGVSNHATQHALAMAEGLQNHGITTILRRNTELATTKHVACWSWRVGRRLRAARHEVLVMERGYLGDRFAWTSLGWNGLNGRAKFFPREDPTRFERNFGPLQPWKDSGEYVLLIGQVPGDASLGGMNLSMWYENTARTASTAYKLPVVFRPHPEALKRHVRQRVKGTRVDTGTLEEALSDAAIVITYNSNTAVNSVVAGVPTIAVDMGSMAYEMCGHKIGERLTPDREQWAARLAWCQWEMDEIKSGEAWSAMAPR